MNTRQPGRQIVARSQAKRKPREDIS